jgi:ABC-type transporter Mla MlaB component
MPIVNIRDRADELRIEIAGRLQAEAVDRVAQAWRTALKETPPRKCIVDISRLNGYDAAGCKLLRDIYHHGTQIAASTASSLIFLSEISTPRRRGGPALVREKPPNPESGTKTAPTASCGSRRVASRQAHRPFGGRCAHCTTAQAVWWPLCASSTNCRNVAALA